MKKFKESKIEDSPSFDNFTTIIIIGDGNCLFRAILYSQTGSDEDHLELRKMICGYISKKKKIYQHYFIIGEEGLMYHLKIMKKPSTWGTYYELYAASELLCFNYVVYCAETSAIYSSTNHNDNFPTIYLEFQNGNHFNSLIEKGKKDFSIDEKDRKFFSKTIKNRTQSFKDYHFDTEGNLNKIKRPEENNETKEDGVLSLKKHQAIYPLAKNRSNIYNESYQFLTKKIIPQRFLEKNDEKLVKKRIKNWTKKFSRFVDLKTKGKVIFQRRDFI